MVDPKDRVVYKLLGEFQMDFDSTAILLNNMYSELNNFMPGTYYKPPAPMPKQFRNSFSQTELQNVFIDIKQDV